MSRKALLGLLAAAAVAVGGVSAAAGTTGKKQPHAHGLVGTWQSTVVLPAPAPPLRSMQVFSPGGGWVESSNENPRSRSAMDGSWERLHGRLYATTGVHFLFDPQTGAYLGKRKVDSTREVSEDGESYSAVSRVTTFDANGSVLGTFMSRATAERLPVDRIPDQP
jgi:hypothetical protein